MSPKPHSELANRCAIAIMAKAPDPGRVKTRLAPFLGPQGARDISCCFLSDMTKNLAEARLEAPIDGYIAYAPAGDVSVFAPIVEPGTSFVLADGSVDAAPGVVGFGRCLTQAAWALLDMGYGGVALLNSDSPTLPTALLTETARHLLAPGDRVVLGPSLDGGYYTIGLKQRHPGLFRDIAWSTAQVAAQTRDRAREARLDIQELATWYDIDDEISLRRLRTELADGKPSGSELTPYRAAATSAWFRLRGEL